jgi:hypothetical protein
MQSLGAGAVAAPAVKAVVELPDHRPEKFTGTGFPIPNLMDVGDGLLYDRIRIGPGRKIPHIMNFFCTPLGQICPYALQDGLQVLKTYRHTNMMMAAQLPPPTEFLAQRILFAVHPSAHQADIDSITGASAWEFQLCNKTMARAPMLMNGPAHAGLRDIVRHDGTAATPMPQGVMAAAHHSPIARGFFIPSLVYFAVRVETLDEVCLMSAADGGRGLDILIAFQGARAWGVQ